MTLHNPELTSQHSCPLTVRQLSVVQGLSHGLAAKNVAYTLNLKASMVQRDVANACRAVGVINTTGLVAKALRMGWIQ